MRNGSSNKCFLDAEKEWGQSFSTIWSVIKVGFLILHLMGKEQETCKNQQNCEKKKNFVSESYERLKYFVTRLIEVFMSKGMCFTNRES